MSNVSYPFGRSTAILFCIASLHTLVLLFLLHLWNFQCSFYCGHYYTPKFWCCPVRNFGEFLLWGFSAPASFLVFYRTFIFLPGISITGMSVICNDGKFDDLMRHDRFYDSYDGSRDDGFMVSRPAYVMVGFHQRRIYT